MDIGKNFMDSFSRRPPRVKVEIELDCETKGSTASYTTLDKIEGMVTCIADENRHFDHIAVTFEGTSKCTLPLELPTVHRAREIKTSHTFLKLCQPIDENSYPEPRELQAQRLYQFPFTFIVPKQLLPRSCTHSTNNENVKAAHLELPPSLGHSIGTVDGKALLDGLTPEAAEISYRIRASVLEQPSATAPKQRPLASTEKVVHILPARDEQLPTEASWNYTDDYCERVEKDVRQGMLRRKTGRLVAAAAQTKPLQLPPPGADGDSSVSGTVELHVRFDPENNEDPPQLGTVSRQLRVLTYYASLPWNAAPSKKSILSSLAMRDVHSSSINLSSLCIDSAQWVKHTRTGSDAPCPVVDESPALHSRDEYYTASIVVPIALPKKKTFVPTFHSCVISRVYVLDLSLSHPSKISLKVPILITAPYHKTIMPNDGELLPSYPHIDEDLFDRDSFTEESATSNSISETPSLIDSGLPEYSVDMYSSVRLSVQ